MAHDVFHLHDGIVHQNANHQRQRQQCHHIDGKAQISHANECRNHRQRQRHGRHKSRPQVTQKQPDHQHRQNRPLVQQVQGAAVLLFHRGHKVKGLGELDVGVLGTEVGQGLTHQTAHGHFAFAFAAHHLKAHHGGAIEAGGRTWIGQGVTHRSDLVQAHAHAARGGQLDPPDFLRGLDRGQGSHRLLTHAQVHATARAFLLHLLELARDFRCREAQRLQAVHIQRNAHLARDPANPVDGTDTAHRQKLARDLVVHQPGQGLVVHAAGAHGVCQHRCARQVEFLHDGVAQVTGQIGAHALNGRAHLVHRFLRWLLHAELGADVDHTVLHLGGDVLEPLQGGQRIFKFARHIGFEL